jgi:hypothetical protein
MVGSSVSLDFPVSPLFVISSSGRDVPSGLSRGAVCHLGLDSVVNAADIRPHACGAPGRLTRMTDNPELLQPDDIDGSCGGAFVGYDAEINAAIALCQAVAEGLLKREDLLVFGMPGTGKSAFGDALAFKLNEFRRARGLPLFHLFRLRGTALRYQLDDAQIEETLRRLGENYLQNNVPVIVLFDEMDAIAPARHINPERQPLVQLMMGFQDALPAQTVCLWITNEPENVDMAIRSRLGYPLYLDFPDIAMATGLFRDLGPEKAGALVRQLYMRAAQKRETFSIRSIMKAADKVRKLSPTGLEMTIEQLVEDVSAGCQGITLSEVQAYRVRYANLIAKSKETVAFWTRRYNLLLEG